METDISLAVVGIHIVAPRVGAWIETSYVKYVVGVANVAPRVGAWIETILFHFRGSLGWSRPAWARGLKRLISVLFAALLGRAPRGRVD